MKAHTQEQELIAIKLRSLQDEAALNLGMPTAQSLIGWFVKYALKTTLQSVPRVSHLQVIHSVLSREKGHLDLLFKEEKTVCMLLQNAREIYDLAYIHEQHVVSTGGVGRDSREIVTRLDKQFGEFLDRAQDIDSILFTQNLNLFISLKQAFPKQASDLLSNPQFRRQRQQVAKCYQFVLKPLFEKKSLNKHYIRLTRLASWLVLMGEQRPDLAYDLAKKINSYVIYNKSDTSIEMINVCNTVFDLLTIKFPRETGLKHQNLAALLFRLEDPMIRMGVFLDFWLQARRNFLDTIDFQNMFRVLSLLGLSYLVVSLLIRVWNAMINLRKFNIVLHIFSGFIRKEFTRLCLKSTDEFTQYFKIIKHFMIGLSNRERFEGQQIDQMTNNICEHAMKKGISISTCYKHIVQIYSTYENRFSCLSDTSKQFFSEVQALSKIKLQTADIHNLYDQYIIREVGLDQGDQGWQSLRKTSNRYRGLQNLGNTCYMNAFMQALYMTKKFRMLIHNFTQDGSLPSDKVKLYALQYLFEELTRKEFQFLQPHKPEYFKLQLPEPFRSSQMQQDAAEFGRIFLEVLAKELQGGYLQKMEKLLGQKLLKIIRCQKCSSMKKQEESLFDLILTLQQGQSQIYLSRLIQNYFKPEKFTGQNRIDCPKCQDRTDSISELIPQKFSDILVLTLSIFQYVGQGKKILLPLTFQFTLNLGVLLSSAELGQYQLYAFIVHIGSQQGSGHYVCYARNLQQNPMIWYNLNDGYVQQLEISKPQDFGFGEMQTPYMLFYSKKSLAVSKLGKS